jgi:hypothetical protein
MSGSISTRKASTLAASIFLPPVGSRPPGPSDDTSLGFTLNSLWNNGGRIHAPVRVDAGRAVWQERGAGATPCDACPTPVGAWGTVKLVAAYTGPALRVRRVSDNTERDIGFIGGDLDVFSLDAFSGGATLYVPVVYDQTGNGNHLTQTVAASQPRMNGEATLDRRGKARVIQQMGALFGSRQVMSWFDIPTTVTLNSQAASMFMVGTLPGCVQATPIVEMNPTTGTAYFQWFYGTSASTFTLNTAGQTKSSSLKVAVNATVHSVIAGAFSSGNQSATTSSIGSSINYAGGKLGAMTAGAAVTSNDTAELEWSAFAIYGRVVSETDRRSFCAAAYRRFEITPQESDVVIYRGDSIHFGQRTTALYSPIRRLRNMLDLPAQYFNASRSGATLSGLLPVFAAEVAPLFRTGARNNVFVSAAMTNDIVNTGGTAASIYELLMQHFELARAACPTVKLVATTVIDRGAFTAPQRQLAIECNALIRANAGRIKSHAVIDYAADPGVGLSEADAADFFPNSPFNDDGTHPNDNGVQVMAAIAAPVIRSVWSF